MTKLLTSVKFGAKSPLQRANLIQNGEWGLRKNK